MFALRAVVKTALMMALIIVSSAFVSRAAQAVIRTVPTEYPTIQDALNASDFGDRVVVAPGTYVENLVIGAEENGVWLRSESGPALTIIDGSLQGPVVRCSAASSATRIEGFTIRNGGDFVGQTTLGGGLHLESSSVTVVGNVIRENRAFYGGGIYVDGGQPAIQNNQILSNYVSAHGSGIMFDHGAGGMAQDNVIDLNHADNGSGAGIHLANGSTPTIERNRISNNLAPTLSGGGISSFDSAPTIHNNTIESNRAGDGGGLSITGPRVPTVTRNLIRLNVVSGAGGGIRCLSGSPTIESNIIARNSSVNSGGGVIVLEGTPMLRSNTIVENHASADDGAGILIAAPIIVIRNIVAFNEGHGVTVADGGPSVQFECGDVYGNTVSDYHNLPDPTGTLGNIRRDPLFCNRPLMDYELTSPSPCTAANHQQGCLIGALDVGCAPTTVSRKSWGAVRTLYR